MHQLITEQLGRRAPPTSEALFRNQLKFLTVAAGLPEVRLLVAQHFEQWVQNTKVRVQKSHEKSDKKYTLESHMIFGQAP